jgi:D-alanyl-D-alanine carboxypeptidase
MFKIVKITVAMTLIPIMYVMASIVSAAEYAPSSKSAILINYDDCSVLYEKNADLVLPMASTTKIMTALTALEYFTPDTIMTIPKESVGTEGTSACLEEGERYTLQELLYALLLQSANDAASAIAINTAGTEDAFALLMNRKARSLGLSNTQFKNPHGLPAEGHYTTARELAIIAREALHNEIIANTVSTVNKKIESESGKMHYFHNHNKLLSSYNGANGVKTGYTKASGRCLVSSAERDGKRLIAVTLNSHDDWREHTAMLNYGFELLSK